MADLQTPSHSTRRHFILGTAGHIDHGKTTLVRALTGTDTDRLPEEKRRGMTIELGFAQLEIGDVTFGIVDVPGHERFVRTMVAGATGVDIALLIVAADDSVMPQTIEHVEILDLLGIDCGVVAITKCDVVEEDMIELVEAEVQELLAGTRLKHALVVRVSGATGLGIETLREHLVEAADAVEKSQRRLPFRMPVDRVFTVAGRGTVVTGSVNTGSADRGDTVDIWPIGRQARIREIQTHGSDAESVHAGQRAAINLQGVDKDEIDRGCELVSAGALSPTRLVDARLTCLRSHRQPIRNHARVRLCIGTREVLARCVCLDADGIEPGSTALVQLRCYEPVVASFGQRFIVRDENAARTAGGGVVLRAAARRISNRMSAEVDGLRVMHGGEDMARVAEVVRYCGLRIPEHDQLALAAGVDPDAVADHVATLRTNKQVVELAGADRLISAAFVEAFERRACGWLKNYHTQHPDEPGCVAETFTGWLERKSDRAVGRAIRQRLLDTGSIKLLGRYVCLKEFAPALSAQDERVMQAVLAEFHEGAFQPPTVDELVKSTGANKQRIDKLLKVAVSVGQLVRVDNSILLHADRESEMRKTLIGLYKAEGAFTLSRMREALDSSRKYAVPLAEYLDREGFTVRKGDTREIADAISNDE